jgi:hypothetical protein
MRPVPVLTRPVYPPSGIAHRGLADGGLTVPIERGDEVSEWKENQRAKERADVVVKDGELLAVENYEMEKNEMEKNEMEKRVCEWTLVRGCGRMHVAPRAQS